MASVLDVAVCHHLGGRLQVLEVAESILAGDEMGKRCLAGHLLHRRRDIPNRQSDPTVCRGIRVRGVEEVTVMQRHVARFQNRVNSCDLVHLERDLLTSRQHVRLIERIAMTDDPTLVTARDEPHAALIRRGRS